MKDAKEKIFLVVGDLVDFEVTNKDSKNRPRWQDGVDCGGSGVVARGIVTFVTPKIVGVKYEIDGFLGEGYSEWPNTEHPQYVGFQWKRLGYLRKVSCECGSDAVYGNSAAHSHWCYKGIFISKSKFILNKKKD